MDDAAAEGLIPGIDAENEIQFFAEALEIRRVGIQPIPDALGENLRVVVLVEKVLKEFQELGNDAVRALGFPEFGKPRKFILGEAVLHQPEILDGAGKDELVDEENDGLGGKFGRGPFDLLEFMEPDFKVFEELLFEFWLVGGVFDAPQGIQHTAGFPAPVEEISERQLGKGFALKIEIPRAEKPGGAQIGERQVFVIAQILFDLGDVMLGVGIAAPDRVRAVPLEQRLEFKLHGISHAFREHEVHVAFGHPNLPGRLKTQHIFAECGKEVFGGGFGFGPIFQVQRILVNGRIVRDRLSIGRERQEFNPLAFRELLEGFEYVVCVHRCFVRRGIVSERALNSRTDSRRA